MSPAYLCVIPFFYVVTVQHATACLTVSLPGGKAAMDADLQLLHNAEEAWRLKNAPFGRHATERERVNAHQEAKTEAKVFETSQALSGSESADEGCRVVRRHYHIMLDKREPQWTLQQVEDSFDDLHMEQGSKHDTDEEEGVLYFAPDKSTCAKTREETSQRR